jgi:hypothetical protein
VADSYFRKKNPKLQQLNLVQFIVQQRDKCRVMHPVEDRMSLRNGKGKGQFNPRTGHEDPEEELRYIAILFFNFGER